MVYYSTDMFYNQTEYQTSFLERIKKMFSLEKTNLGNNLSADEIGIGNGETHLFENKFDFFFSAHCAIRFNM